MVINCFSDGLESGVVQPLNTTVFKEVHSALRFLNSGAHIGKVLVELSKDKCEPDSEMRDPLEIVHGSQFQPAFLRQETDVRTAAAKREGVFEFQPVTDGHYLITGGMGSLGLEVRQSYTRILLSFVAKSYSCASSLIVTLR